MSAAGVEALKPIASMLEFGSHDGSAYRWLEPARYHGIDLVPLWFPSHDSASVEEADVMSWEPPPGAQFDLVYCDAHAGESTAYTEMFFLTERQVQLALRVNPQWVAVDDCYIPGIRDAAVGVLGEPTIARQEPTQCWIWRRR